LGIGLNAEQYLAKDVGLFLRAMYTDGQSEVDAFDSADADLSFGAVAKGWPWGRPFDIAGIGFETTWITNIHAAYLAMGGIDNFVGDGRLRKAQEGMVELFYSVNLFKSIWLAANYQLIWNPGYNADRAGPIHIPGAKVHAEF
jgi:carbohydrate-selective porin OprB